MKQILAGLIVSLFTFLTLSTPVAAQIGVFDECDASPVTGDSRICADKDSGRLLRDGSLLRNGLEIFIYLVGFISLVMIVVGGLKMVMTQGDPQQIQSARNTIIYAVIGLVIALASQSILTFVVDRV